MKLKIKIFIINITKGKVVLIAGLCTNVVSHQPSYGRHCAQVSSVLEYFQQLINNFGIFNTPHRTKSTHYIITSSRVNSWLYLDTEYPYIHGTLYVHEASRGAGAQSVIVNATCCGFDPHSQKLNIYLNLYFHFSALVSRQSAALSSAT